MGLARTRRHRVIVQLGLAIAAGPAASGAVAPPPDPDDAAVYRAILAAYPTRLVQSTTQPPLGVMGSSQERIAALPNHLRGLDASTIRSFQSRNRDNARIPELGDSTVVWIAAEEWRALANRRDGWEEIRRRAPGSRAVLAISRPGFSQDGSRALVYVIVACEGLCSYAHYVLLSRDGGGWREVARVLDWMS